MKLLSLFTILVASNPLNTFLLMDQIEDKTTKMMLMINSMVSKEYIKEPLFMTDNQLLYTISK